MSHSDAVIARAGSARALAEAKFARQPIVDPHGTSNDAPSYVHNYVHYTSYDALQSHRMGYYGSVGWNPPIYIYQSQPSFGAWDALWMWWLLDSAVNSQQHADFFYHHSDDPGVIEWRREADRLADQNADLKAKLAAIDANNAARQKEAADNPGANAKDASYLPPDTDSAVALASYHVLDEPAAPSRFWSNITKIVVAIAGGLLFAMVLHSFFNRQRYSY